MLEKRPNQISFKLKKKTKNKLISLSKLTNSQRRYIYFQTKKKNLFKRYGQITTSQHVVRSFAHGTHTHVYIQYREKKSEGMKTNSLERKRRRRRRKLVVVESTGRS
jgi:catabolite regulation protein CreA